MAVRAYENHRDRSRIDSKWPVGIEEGQGQLNRRSRSISAEIELAVIGSNIVRPGCRINVESDNNNRSVPVLVKQVDLVELLVEQNSAGRTGC